MVRGSVDRRRVRNQSDGNGIGRRFHQAGLRVSSPVKHVLGATPMGMFVEEKGPHPGTARPEQPGGLFEERVVDIRFPDEVDDDRVEDARWGQTGLWGYTQGRLDPVIHLGTSGHHDGRLIQFEEAFPHPARRTRGTRHRRTYSLLYECGQAAFAMATITIVNAPNANVINQGTEPIFPPEPAAEFPNRPPKNSFNCKKYNTKPIPTSRPPEEEPLFRVKPGRRDDFFRSPVRSCLSRYSGGHYNGYRRVAIS